MAKKSYVLTAYDYEDGGKRIIATMDLDDNSRSRKDKGEILRKFLKKYYKVWIGGCDEEEAMQCRSEIDLAAKRLCSKDNSADCCGDCLSWEEVTNL